MRENLALRYLRIDDSEVSFYRRPRPRTNDSLSAEEVIQLCKNKKKGFTFRNESRIAAEDFMRVIKMCPHIVF